VEHLKDNELAEMLEGVLPPDRLSLAEEHVDACPSCLKLLASAARVLSISREGTLPPAEAIPLARGALVGRYVVLEPLGAGGMGLVYASYDGELDRKVALKILRPGSTADDLRARVQREAQALARLNHPNVITIYEVGTFQEQLFLSMELVEGATLRDWLHEKKRKLQEVLDVFLQAGNGLAAAHRAGVVHRDFKPDNVMVGKDGRVRVTDFGVARLDGRYSEEVTLPGGTSPAHESLTASGTVIGSPAYMAPEQMAGKPADARADIFSFCVTLYEALYGERPFAGHTLDQVRIAVASGSVRPAPSGAHVPSRVRRELLRGLANDREKRFASMDELLRALRKESVRWRRALLISLGAVAALALGYLALRPHTGSRLSANPKAQELYLQALTLAADGTQLANALEAVVALDPGFASAWADLAAAYADMGRVETGSQVEPKIAFPKAKEAAHKAIALDPSLPKPHAVLGTTLASYDRDYAAAEREFQTALRLNPQRPGGAHHDYSHLLIALGRFDESLRQSLLMRDAFPFSRALPNTPSPWHFHLVWHYYMARDFEQARSLAMQFAPNVPEDVEFHLKASQTELQLGHPAEALRWLPPQAAPDKNAELDVQRALVLGALGRRDDVLAIERRLLDAHKDRYGPAYDLALVRLALGDKAGALQRLREAIDERGSWVMYMAVDPRLDPLAHEPAFRELLQLAGLREVTPHVK
jgi:tetratricopeptide (TPR) repeat protein/predicted Ser/Thr protein kinase